MRKYNASPLRVLPRGLASATALAALALLAAGCAGPAPAPIVSAQVPVPVDEPPAPETIEPIADNQAALAAAGPLSLREDAPLRYTVKKGDTLWGIAEYYLRDAWQWPELWYTNGQVRNPHRIHPGDVLTLIAVDGHTRLAPASTLDVERRSPQIRESALDIALPTIPIEAIRNFLRGPRLVTLEESRRAPYVLAFLDEHLAASANTDVYVKNLVASDAGGYAPSYAVVHVGEAYRDPDTGELLGYEAIPAGEAELRVPGQPATMRLTRSSREVIIADRLLPIEAESFEANFYPHAPATPVEGRILSVFDGLSQISQYQIVALNRGSAQGLDPGTVLDIFQSGQTVADPYGGKPVRLPDTRAGLLMVFKVTPKLSYALVMSANRPVHVLDRVRRPVAGQR